MKKMAIKDNETLRIKKGGVYEMRVVWTADSLVIVRNDVGDDVVMSLYDFEDEDSE